MVIQQLRLVQFKSYEAADFRFEGRIHAITGRNGTGKTNLLDALHHLSLARSAFNRQDQSQIFQESPFYRLDARLENDGQPARMELTYARQGKKEIRWNGAPVERLAEHVGRIPVVLILPDEPYQMKESMDWRRSFIDTTLSQAFPEYLSALSRYKKILAQKAATLKYFQQRNQTDFTLLATLNEGLVRESEPLFQFREKYLPSLALQLAEQYAFLSEMREEAGLRYEPLVLFDQLGNQLESLRYTECQQARCLAGPHRDDYAFLLNQLSIKKRASQGQQKTFLLALKLAQYQFLKDRLGKSPWLLLDDIFDKLDDFRIQRLLERISQPDLGQVFLTDAREERLRSLLEKKGLDFQVVPVSGT